MSAPPVETVEEPPAPTQPPTTETSNDEILRRLTYLEGRNNYLEGAHSKRIQAAFDGVTEDFLEALDCDDPEGKTTFISGLRRMAANPHIGGAEGDAVMQVICAASRLNQKTQNSLEKALTELKTGKATPEAAPPNKRPKTTNFANASERLAAVQTHSGPAGQGMKTHNPNMYAWLSAENDN